jgi:ABC-2 type transport system permease protein
MRVAAALFRRELGVYFVNPLAYIILTCVMLIFGFDFYFRARTSAAMNAPFVYSQVLFSIAGLMVFVTPLLTMRLIAEEKNRGTFETLMTSPVTEIQVVLSKFLATMTFIAFLMVPTLAHLILVSKYGTVDYSEVVSGYFGLFLTTASLMAIGMFVSSVCSNQVTAGVVTFVAISALLFTAIIPTMISEHTALGRTARDVIQTLNPYQNMEDFLRGIVDTRPVVYLLSLIVFFLFLSVRTLETRRWR